MKLDPIRWNVGQAASEFGLDRRTLAERVKNSGAVAGEDGKFSTRQIAAAVYGDLAGEKLRKMRAEADLAEMEVREKQKTCIPREVFFPVIDQVHGAIASIIRRSPLPARDQDEILTELNGLPQTLWGKGYKPPEESSLEVQATKEKLTMLSPVKSSTDGNGNSHSVVDPHLSQ